MKAVLAIFLALALVLGANAIPKHRQVNRLALENKLRMLLKPGFKTPLDDNLYRFIDTDVRSWFINGNPDLGLPVLDPLVIDRLDIDLNQDGLVLVGYVENVVITGNSKFKIVSVVTDETAKSAVIDISLDAAKVVGEHYVLDGDIGGVLPVWGEGAFQLDLNQLTLHIRLVLSVKADGFLEIGDLELDVGLGSGTVNFENLLGGGDLGAIANDYISQELPNLVEANKAPILADLVVLLKDLFNPALGKYTYDDLLALINSTPRKA